MKYKCPNCGNEASFDNIDPQREEIHCKECDSIMEPIDKGEEAVEEFKQRVKESIETDEVKETVERIVSLHEERESILNEIEETENQISDMEEKINCEREDLEDLKTDSEALKMEMKGTLQNFNIDETEEKQDKKIDLNKWDITKVSKVFEDYKENFGKTLGEITREIGMESPSYLSELKNNKLNPTSERQKEVVRKVIRFLQREDYLNG